MEFNLVVEYIIENTSREDSIYIFPWNPELYFVANRRNATSIYTPYAFWSEEYQRETVEELKVNNPALIIVNPGARFGQLGPENLSIIENYINENYEEVEQIYSFRIMILKADIEIVKRLR